MLQYGDKRNFKKIDIFINGKYECSTNWAKTCKEAIERYKEFYKVSVFNPFVKITAHFSQR